MAGLAHPRRAGDAVHRGRRRRHPGPGVGAGVRVGARAGGRRSSGWTTIRAPWWPASGGRDGGRAVARAARGPDRHRARIPRPGHPRAEGDRQRGEALVDGPRPALRRGRARAARDAPAAGAGHARGAALLRVPPVRHRAAPGGPDPDGRAGRRAAGGARRRGLEPGRRSGARLRGAARVPGDRAVDRGRGRDPGVRRRRCRERRRLPPAGDRDLGARGRVRRYGRADAGAARALPRPARPRAAPARADGHRPATTRAPALAPALRAVSQPPGEAKIPAYTRRPMPTRDDQHAVHASHPDGASARAAPGADPRARRRHGHDGPAVPALARPTSVASGSPTTRRTSAATPTSCA